MNVTIIGTGNMAHGIAIRLLAGDHSVRLFGTDESKAATLAEELRGSPDRRSRGRVEFGTICDEIIDDVVVLAVPYPEAGPLVARYGDQLSGRTVVDITNPLDSSHENVVTPPGCSAAEQIAMEAAPGVRVAKAFNTTFAKTLVSGTVAGRPLDVFIASDDPDAKQVVTELVESGGLRAVDAGPLVRSRQLEALGQLHIGLQETLETDFCTAVRVDR